MCGLENGFLVVKINLKMSEAATAAHMWPMENHYCCMSFSLPTWSCLISYMSICCLLPFLNSVKRTEILSDLSLMVLKIDLSGGRSSVFFFKLGFLFWQKLGAKIDPASSLLS